MKKTFDILCTNVNCHKKHENVELELKEVDDYNSDIKDAKFYDGEDSIECKCGNTLIYSIDYWENNRTGHSYIDSGEENCIIWNIK